MAQLIIYSKNLTAYSLNKTYNSLAAFDTKVVDVKFNTDLNLLQSQNKIKLTALTDKGVLFNNADGVEGVPATVGDIISNANLSNGFLKFKGEGAVDGAFSENYSTTFKYKTLNANDVVVGDEVTVTLNMVDLKQGGAFKLIEKTNSDTCQVDGTMVIEIPPGSYDFIFSINTDPSSGKGFANVISGDGVFKLKETGESKTSIELTTQLTPPITVVADQKGTFICTTTTRVLVKARGARNYKDVGGTLQMLSCTDTGTIMNSVMVNAAASLSFSLNGTIIFTENCTAIYEAFVQS